MLLPLLLMLAVLLMLMLMFFRRQCIYGVFPVVVRGQILEVVV